VFSSLTQKQLDDADQLPGEYEYLKNLTEGECVPVDVAKTSAWECQPLSYYLGEIDDTIWSPYPYKNATQDQKDEFNNRYVERYQVVSLGAPIRLEESRKFSIEYIVGAAIVGAGRVYILDECGETASTESSAPLPTR